MLIDSNLNWRLPASTARVVAGALVASGASAMLGLSLVHFRRYGGGPPVSALPPGHVMQQGVYAVWRHPIYLFFWLFWLGLALVWGSGGMLLVVLPALAAAEAVYVVLEERMLVRRFGEPYRQYRRRTPLLVPRLGNWTKPLLRAWCRLVLNYEVRGLENLPGAPPYFLVAAHRNYLDPFFLGHVVPHPVRFVTTFEMFRTPLLRFVFRRFLSIPRRRYLDDIASARELLASVRQGWPIGIFPEGERSWTGRTQIWKPEVMSLFRRFHEVPVVPVRLDGDYRSWPRWGANARRARLRIVFGAPVRISEGASEETLRQAVEPDDTGALCRTPDRVRDITKVIYRCPSCRSFGGLVLAPPDRFSCGACQTGFVLGEDYRVRYEAGAEVRSESIADLYDRIRFTVEDVPAGEGERSVAECAGATLWLERGTRFVKSRVGRLVLTTGRFRIEDARGAAAVPLKGVSSVTTESNRKLQVYQVDEAKLYQLTFDCDSVLMWQDRFCAVLESVHGVVPNRR